MKLPVFDTEQWMTNYEGQAVYNLTDTSVKAFRLSELLALQPDSFDPLLDYGEISGDMDLKHQILSLYLYGDADNITTASGCLHANELVMLTLLEPEDHVIAFVPGYQQFTDYPLSLGCTVSKILLQEENDWLPDFNEIEAAINEKSKLIIINNPSNPTGSFLERNDLERLVEIARKHDLWILSDEVYRGMDCRHNISVSDLYEKGIATSSVSKMFSLPGLRLGWVKADKSLIEQINFRRDYSMISTGPLSDQLAALALKNKDIILKRNERIITKNKNALFEWLKDNSAFSIVMPEDGSVGFLKFDLNVQANDLSKQLLERFGLFFVPSECFGFEKHLRIGFGQDPELFREGLSILGNYTKRIL